MRKRLLVVVGLLVVAALVWVFWPSTATAPQPLAPDELAARDAGSRRAIDQTRDFVSSVPVFVTVVDGQGLPVPDVTLSLGDGETQTGGDGKASFSGRIGEVLQIHLPHRSANGNEPMVHGPREDWVIPVVLPCDGDILLRHADGRPAVDWSVSLQGYAGSTKTDLEGRIQNIPRPCGEVTARFYAPDTDARLPWQTVHVDGPQALELWLPPLHSGELLVVDAETLEPLDVTVQRSTKAVTLDALARGHFAITSYHALPTLVLEIPGQQDRYVKTPLDGELFVVPIDADRQVEVTLLCDLCPEQLTCQDVPCRGQGGWWDCTCLPALSFIEGDGMRLAEVQPGVTEMTLDLRKGTIVGHWTGKRPCSVFATSEVWARSADAGCEPDGSFRLDVPAGTWNVEVDWFEEEAGNTGWFTVEAGQTVDVGAVQPEDNIVSGYIDADFELDAWLLTAPWGQATVYPDGYFEISGVPADVGDIRVILQTAAHGRWDTVLRTDESIVWTIRWQTDHGAVRPEDLRSSPDSGWDSGDTG
ncbi:MAG: hypothetical protein GY913_23065 [Proteobacteria bacterium]|nr:hypothetical protein [Pseudomonadota bacterium]MCP4919793.1 hypothetical protein [Pseudomonadota bacterium]